MLFHHVRVCGEAVLLDFWCGLARIFLFQVAVIRLKPNGLRCVDISGNFNAVLLLFCAVFIYRYFCAVFLCYSVRCLYRYFCAVFWCSYLPYALLSLDFCLI